MQTPKARSKLNFKFYFTLEPSEDKAELDDLICAFTSPMPSNILVDYDVDKKKKKKTKDSHPDQESVLEHLELKGPVFREFTMHIF